MPNDRDPLLELDERTARLGRQWYAEAKQRRRDEEAERKQRKAKADADTSGEAGSFDWLFGASDSDCADGGSDD